MVKVIGLICVLFSSVVGASLTEEPIERDDTKIVLIQPASALGETQVGLVVTFIETTLGVKLNENAVRVDTRASRYKSNKWIGPAEQQLIVDTLPVNYEVRVTFPLDTKDYKARPDKGNGGGSSQRLKKNEKSRQRTNKNLS